MSFNLETAQAAAKTRFDWTALAFITAFHVGAVAALFYFSWGNLLAFGILYLFAGKGITVGYHRLLTHKSFKVPKWLERTWAVLGALNLQGGPIIWVAQHRQHHAESDTHLDPHDINKSFMWAHMFWIFKRYPVWFEDGQRSNYAPDVMKDGFYRWLDKYHYVPSLVVGAVLLGLGGFGMFLWGICLRLCWVYHSTWFVNSAAHRWGYRPFKEQLATNNWWVAILALGEGWHNNHHQFPTSAKHGLRFWEFDFSWISIWTMKKLGLASKIKLPSRDQLPWKNAADSAQEAG